MTAVAERLAMALSLPDLKTSVCRGWDLNIHPSACGANVPTNYAIDVTQFLKEAEI